MEWLRIMTLAQSILSESEIGVNLKMRVCKQKVVDRFSEFCYFREEWLFYMPNRPKTLRDNDGKNQRKVKIFVDPKEKMG